MVNRGGRNICAVLANACMARRLLSEGWCGGGVSALLLLWRGGAEGRVVWRGARTQSETKRKKIVKTLVYIYIYIFIYIIFIIASK